MEDILLGKNNTKYGGNVLYWYCCDLASVLTHLRVPHTRTNAQKYIKNYICMYVCMYVCIHCVGKSN